MWLSGGESSGKAKNSRVLRRVLARVLARYIGILHSSRSISGSVRRKTGSIRPTSSVEDSINNAVAICPAEMPQNPFFSSFESILTLFRITKRSAKRLHLGSYFWKHLRHFSWRNLIKMKLKAKGREKSNRINFFLVVGLIVALGKFSICASPVILWGKMQLTFILTCFAKYDLLVDFFVVTNQANYQDS